MSIVSQIKPDIRISRAGLAFVARVEATTHLPTVEVTLLLRWVEVAIISSLLAIGAVVFNFHGQIANSWLIGKWAASNQTTAALFIGATIFVLGWILAIWKHKQKFTYSITEIAFAVLSAFQIGLSLWPNGELSKFVALGSALYVASRGAGNLWEAFVEEAEKLERLKVTVA